MSELTKNELYESVKSLVECDHPHLHLNQHKLFTLFSIAFQYLLFSSTKNPGAYILRVEDSLLADRLSKKSKDPSTRKFMQTLLIPRKFAYNKSLFYLDFFNATSWNLTRELSKEKVKAAIIVKNTSSRPLSDSVIDQSGEESQGQNAVLPKDYYLKSLKEFVPRTITIAFEENYDDLHVIHFPFIKKESVKSLSGVTVGKDVDWDSMD